MKSKLQHPAKCRTHGFEHLMAAFTKNITVNGSREERMHLVPSPHTDKNLMTRKNYGERIER